MINTWVDSKEDQQNGGMPRKHEVQSTKNLHSNDIKYSTTPSAQLMKQMTKHEPTIISGFYKTAV